VVVADDLVLEQLKGIRRDMATKADLKDLASRDQLRAIEATLRADVEALRGEMLRHFVEVETRVGTEIHELISLIRELVSSRDRLAARVSQLERDVQELKSKTG
jgi:hypothetical protein